MRISALPARIARLPGVRNAGASGKSSVGLKRWQFPLIARLHGLSSREFRSIFVAFRLSLDHLVETGMMADHMTFLTPGLRISGVGDVRRAVARRRRPIMKPRVPLSPLTMLALTVAI